MSFYTDRLALLAAKSDGKLTVEELDRTITEASAVSGLHKLTVLDALQEALKAYGIVEQDT